MTWATEFTFKVEPEEKTAPIKGWKSEGAASPWVVGAASAKIAEEYQTDENLKKQYGIELAKTNNPFEAGCKLFGDETNKSLWVSYHWLNDPIVAASRDTYLKTLELSSKPLDREQLAAKVLALVDEKIERAGVLIPTIEAKDRIAALKLYADIMKYTGNVEIDNSTKNITHNEMTIKLVKADNKPVVIDNAPNVKSEMTNEDAGMPIKLKLVSGM